MPSAIFVTTAPITLEAFLLPFADHFRAKGWRIDALVNGATSDPRLAGRFDERFDVAWSRDPLSIPTIRADRLALTSSADLKSGLWRRQVGSRRRNWADELK